ncbi:histidine kinase [Lactiplantibacillus dongliensis]|uniref:Histidine kinase n=1 Tax=Lactiplantibacillus dongliensis TaxID=2559919 RepID=A0ABW1R7A4_9LACO|nr:sensor histidine kinase [Lactiplantibacillus dongliensis]
MFKWRRNYNFSQLMATYAVLLSTVIGLFALYMGTTTTANDNRAIDASLTNGLDKVADQVTANAREVHELGQHLTSTSSQVKNLNKYFELNPAAYLTYSQTTSNHEAFYYLPDETLQLLMSNPTIEQVRITMSDFKTSFVADRQTPGGYKTMRRVSSRPRFQFSYPFVDNANLRGYGTLTLTYQTQTLTTALNKLNRGANLQVLALTPTGQASYHFHGREVTARSARQTVSRVQRTFGRQASGSAAFAQQYRYRTSKLADGSILVAMTDRAVVRQQQRLKNWTLGAEAVAIDVILFGGLWLTFRRYRLQLQQMIQSMALVGRGDLAVRLKVPAQSGDLKIMATGINQMLDEINTYVYQIYQLEIEQRDANMKALQSQIQPHFLYNTLEYIRMYAVAEDQNELAEVVYAFAALLRNNTDQSPTTTLAKETEFIEKYIYLYQMRFPDQIAYGLQLAPILADLTIPKFILQPLVENYFAHGIDYLRTDNVVSVKAWQDGQQRVYLQVQDNGRGMSAAQLATVQAQIKSQQVTGERTSIGLRNVYERLQGYFGERATMTLTRNQQGGLTVMLTFVRGTTDATRHDRG